MSSSPQWISIEHHLNQFSHFFIDYFQFTTSKLLFLSYAPASPWVSTSISRLLHNLTFYSFSNAGIFVFYNRHCQGRTRKNLIHIRVVCLFLSFDFDLYVWNEVQAIMIMLLISVVIRRIPVINIIFRPSPSRTTVAHDSASAVFLEFSVNVCLLNNFSLS